jgi:hypothetical protein
LRDQHYESTMQQKILIAGAVAVFIATAFSGSSADAARRRQLSEPAAGNAGIPSLDGRVLGYPRTCWSDTYQYDSSGATRGPYCH